MQAAQNVITLLQAGQRVAYVSDAGTPAISDPGSRLVAAAVEAGIRVVPIPGASSVTAALSAAGCVHTSGFLFIGFLPAKGADRALAFQEIVGADRAVIVLEAPHRIETLLKELGSLGDRLVTIGRELTKQFESIVTMPALELGAWLKLKPEHARGEFALVIHPKKLLSDKTSDSLSSQAINTTATTLLVRLLQEMPLKSAVQVAVDISGLSKNVLYELALSIKLARPDAS